MGEKIYPEIPPDLEECEIPARHSGIVLVTDQSEDLRWALREAFGSKGFVTILAGSVWASKVALERYQFAAILSGMTLLDGSGLQILAAARSSAPATPVFLMSGLIHEVESLLGLGAVAFFQTPFNVLEAVDEVISYQRVRAVEE